MAEPIARTGARVILLSQDRILLARHRDPARPETPAFWVVPGGGVDPGESWAEAAARELLEETGIALAAESLGGVVAEDLARFEFEGRMYEQRNVFYRAATPTDALSTHGWTDLERRAMDALVWHPFDALAHLSEQVYPPKLISHLPAIVDFRGGPPLWLGD